MWIDKYGKELALFLIMAMLMLTGCSKDDGVDDSRVLSGYDGTGVKTVRNFSAFEETELPTEPPTEETELQTEPSLVEQPFSEDYDFSDVTVLQAAFADYGGLSGADYTNYTVQDFNAKTRTQTCTTSDGAVSVILSAGTKSGTSNSKAIISVSGNRSREQIGKILLRFRNGLDEDKLERFLNGEYNDKASLLGLLSASYTESEGICTASFEKNEMPEGEVPCWENVDPFFSWYVPIERGEQKLLDTSGFTELFSSVDFGNITAEPPILSSIGQKTDASGNVIAREISYSEILHSDNGNSYNITLNKTLDGTGALNISFIRKDAADENIARQFASHICQAFFRSENGSLYPEEHCTVSVNPDGFSMALK